MWDPTLSGRLLSLFVWDVLAIPSVLAAAELGNIFVFLSVGLAETSLPKANSGFLPFLFTAVSSPTGRGQASRGPLTGPPESHSLPLGGPKNFRSDSYCTLANFILFLSNVSSGTLAPTMVRRSPFLPNVQISVVRLSSLGEKPPGEDSLTNTRDHTK